MTTTTSFSLASLLLLAVLTAPASAQSTTGPAGHWEGTIQVPGQELAIQVDLASKAADTWEGAITIPTQNLKAFPLSAITVKDGAVGFAMKGVPGDPKFLGKLSADSHSISGDFSQGGGSFPFTLAWKGEATITPAAKSTPITKDLEGTWEGALDAGGTVLRLVVTLTNHDDGATGIIVSLDQGGGEIPIATVAQAGSHLTLTVSTIGASYEGDLKDGQLVGTWTQGAGKFPLTFKRKS
jgi:hypothetical protein